MTFKTLIAYWKSDYERYRRYGSKFIRIVLFVPGFKYTFWYRFCRYLGKSKNKAVFTPLLIISRFILKHLSYKYGIEISCEAKIGYGLYIGHFGGIFINGDS